MKLYQLSLIQISIWSVGSIIGTTDSKLGCLIIATIWCVLMIADLITQE